MSRKLHIYCHNKQEVSTTDFIQMPLEWCVMESLVVMVVLLHFFAGCYCLLIPIKWMWITKNNHLSSGIRYANALTAVIIFIIKYVNLILQFIQSNCTFSAQAYCCQCRDPHKGDVCRYLLVQYGTNTDKGVHLFPSFFIFFSYTYFTWNLHGLLKRDWYKGISSRVSQDMGML